MEWAEIDDIKCPCKGKGWALRSKEWVECPVHFVGQLHPESRDLLLDDPISLKEEERKSHLKWRIDVHQTELAEAFSRVKSLQQRISMLQYELINKTPTVRMEAVRIDDLFNQSK